MPAVSPSISSPARSESLLLGTIGLGLIAAGVYYVGISFPYPADDREKHLWSLIGGLITGCGLSAGAFAGRHVLHRILRDWSAMRWTLAIVAVVIAAISAASFTAALDAGSGAKANELSLRAFTFLGIALAIATSLLRKPLTRVLAIDATYYLALLSGGAGVFALINWCGMRQFGGFDHSIVIDYGWRLVSGQRPFVDFPSTAPVGFALGAKYCFAAFGVSWRSLIVGFAIFSVTLFGWSAWLFSRLVESRLDRLILGFALQGTCLIPVSYWWYNPITTGTGAIFAFAAYAWLEEPRNWRLALSFAAALFLQAAMKPNVAACSIIFTVLFLFSSSPHRVKVIVLAAATMLLFCGWLALEHMNLLDVIQGYRSVATQAFAPGPFFADPRGFEALLAVVILAYCILPLPGCLLALRKNPEWRGAAIGLGCMTGALNNYVSAGETKLVDIGLIFFCVVLVARACGAWQRSPKVISLAQPLTHYMTFLAIALTCAGMGVGITRHRVRGIGEHYFFEYQLEPRKAETGFFAGMRTGRIFSEVYKEVQATIGAATGERIFFGPRMQWAYAAFRLPSPKNHPVWWHPGVSFARSDVPKYIRAFAEMRNTLLVFVKNDVTYFPPEFIDYLRNAYTLDQSHPALTLWHLKDDRSGNSFAPSAPSASAPPPLSGEPAAPGNARIKNVLTTTVEIDLPPVAPHVDFGTRVRLPGVRADDQLVLSPTAYAGTWGVYYESPDVVVVNYNNPTTVTQDPPPIRFRITAFQF